MHKIHWITKQANYIEIQFYPQTPWGVPRLRRPARISFQHEIIWFYDLWVQIVLLCQEVAECSSVWSKEKRFQRKTVLGRPDNPLQPGDYKLYWWTLSLSPFNVSWCLFCFAYVSVFIMCPLLDLSPRWGTNLPHITLAGARPPLSSPWRVPPEGGVSTALWGSHEAAKGQAPWCGFLVATGGCVWHVGAVAPLGATCHCDTIPPPNVTLWLCYSQLNYSIMTSLLSPNSPNYSLEIYYLIW